MDMASLTKYAKIKKVKEKSEMMKHIFFTPTEELNGGNMFQKLAGNYQIISPYLEIIDGPFIKQMNKKVENVAILWASNYTKVANIRIEHPLPEDEVHISQPELVHMYQTDIVNKTVIDYAFQRNAIYSIKAFVESLMVLPDEI